MKKQKTKNTRI